MNELQCYVGHHVSWNKAVLLVTQDQGRPTLSRSFGVQRAGIELAHVAGRVGRGALFPFEGEFATQNHSHDRNLVGMRRVVKIRLEVLYLHLPIALFLQ